MASLRLGPRAQRIARGRRNLGVMNIEREDLLLPTAAPSFPLDTLDGRLPTLVESWKSFRFWIIEKQHRVTFNTGD